MMKVKYNSKERKTLIERFHLDPNFKVETIAVLNIPVSFCGYDSKGREMWRAIDGKTLYIMN